MKLPQINYNTPVAPLAKENVGAAVALGNQVAQVVTKTAEMGAQIYGRVQTQKGLDEFARSIEQMNALDVEIRNRPASDPKALKTEFDTRMGAIARGPERDLSGISLATWREKFSAKKQVYWFGASNLNASRLLKDQRAETMASVNQLAETDLTAALDQIDASPLFTDHEKSVGRAEIRTSSVQSGIRNAEQSGDKDEILRQLDILEDPAVPLSITERRVATSYLKSALKQAYAADVEAFEQAQELALNELDIGIDKGTTVTADIYAAKKRNIIKTPAKMTEMLRRIAKRGEDALDNSRLSTVLSRALTEGTPLSPGNKDHVKAVNNRYDLAAKQLADTPVSGQQRAALTEELARRGMELAARTNILPKKMLNDLRAYALGGSPAMAARQSVIYAKLQDVAPQSLDTLSPDEESVYVNSAAMLAGGMSPEEAVTLARDNVRLPPEAKAGLGRAYKAEGYGGDRLDSAFSSEPGFEDFLFGGPTPTPVQNGIYAALERQFYLSNGGDIKQAERAAINKFKRIYSRSDAGNPSHNTKVMPYAPERYYGLPADQITRDIMLFAKKNGLKNPKKAFISSDSATAQGLNKDYALWEVNEFGLPQRPRDADGLPLRWQPALAAQETKDEARRADRIQRFNRGDRADLAREEKRISQELKFTPKF